MDCIFKPILVPKKFELRPTLCILRHFETRRSSRFTAPVCLPADVTISTFGNGISGRPREFHLRIRLLVDFSADRGDGISDCADFSKGGAVPRVNRIRQPSCSIELLDHRRNFANYTLLLTSLIVNIQKERHNDDSHLVLFWGA